MTKLHPLRSLVLTALLLAAQPRTAYAEKHCAPTPAQEDDPWARAKLSTLDDGCEDEPAFDGPHLRLGAHALGGAVLGDAMGGFAGLDLLLGMRLWRDFSIISRIDIDLGAWDHPAGSPYLGGALGLGGEYVAPVGRGTAWAFGLTLGPWLRGACQRPDCLSTLLPTATGHVAFFKSRHAPEIALSALSIGLLGSAGYDPVASNLAGRVGVYFGYELSSGSTP